jgi:hypothetical protein
MVSRYQQSSSLEQSAAVGLDGCGQREALGEFARASAWAEKEPTSAEAQRAVVKAAAAAGLHEARDLALEYVLALEPYRAERLSLKKLPKAAAKSIELMKLVLRVKAPNEKLRAVRKASRRPADFAPLEFLCMNVELEHGDRAASLEAALRVLALRPGMLRLFPEAIVRLVLLHSAGASIVEVPEGTSPSASQKVATEPEAETGHSANSLPEKTRDQSAKVRSHDSHLQTVIDGYVIDAIHAVSSTYVHYNARKGPTVYTLQCSVKPWKGDERVNRDIVEACIEQPNVARAIDAVTSADGTSFLVYSPRIRGRSLRETYKDRRIDLAELLDICLKTAKMVRDLHGMANFWHGAISPDTVFYLDSFSETESRIMCLPSALDIRRRRRRTPPRGIAPEGGEPSARWDVYGIGLIAKFLALGSEHAEIDQALFPQESIASELAEFIVRCLASEPSDRYGSMLHVVKALENLIEWSIA